jgi:predicted small lipoprotein YifL
VFQLRRLAAAAVLLAALAGCFGHKDSPTRPPADQPAPDFSLVDQNPNSTTVGKAVSPRQQLNKVSAWYFGHAT